MKYRSVVWRILSLWTREIIGRGKNVFFLPDTWLTFWLFQSLQTRRSMDLMYYTIINLKTLKLAKSSAGLWFISPVVVFLPVQEMEKNLSYLKK